MPLMNGTNPVNPEEINKRYAKIFGSHWLKSPEQQFEKIPIRDAPVMIASDGSIVCIPHADELSVIASVGLTGTGKTLLGGILCDMVFWSWNDNLIVLNDVQEETFTWSEAQDVDKFLYRIGMINAKPMPLPTIYLFPTSNTLQMERFEEYLVDKNYAEISLPFKFVIENIEQFADLGGAEKYIYNIKNELSECQTIQQVQDLVDNKLVPEKEVNPKGGKGFEEMKFKVKVIFNNLFEEGILNLSSSVPSKFIVDNYEGNPLSVILKAGAVPSLITSDLSTKRYKDKLFAYYITLLSNAQLNEFKGQRTWIYFDELARICSTEEKNDAGVALNNIAARMRLHNMSIIYCTQNYSRIISGIKSQTKYCFCFKQGYDEEIKDIGHDFGLKKDILDDLKRLKINECYALTKSFFRVYSQDGEITEVREPIKGLVIPPLHKNKFVK